MFRSLFCWHRWVPVAVYHYIDSSYGGRAQCTTLTRHCDKCGKIKTDNLYSAGWLELDVFQTKAKK